MHSQFVDGQWTPAAVDASSGAEVVAPAVPRALDGVVDDGALAERRTLVEAAPRDGAKAAIDVEDGELVAIDGDLSASARWQLIDGAEPSRCGHSWP